MLTVKLMRQATRSDDDYTQVLRKACNRSTKSLSESEAARR